MNDTTQDEKQVPAPTVEQEAPTPAKPKKKNATPKAVKKAAAAAVQVKAPVEKKPAKRRPPRAPEMLREVAPTYAGHHEGNAVVTGYDVTVALQKRHYDWLVAVAALEGRSIPNMLERLVRVAYSHDPYKGKQPDTSGRSFSGRAADLKP